MNEIISGNFSSRIVKPKSYTYYLSIALLFYVFVFIWRFLSFLTGFKSSASLFKNQSGFDVKSEKRVLGLRNTSFLHIPSDNILMWSKGDYSDFSLVITGAVFLIYAVIIGLSSVFTGLRFHETSVILFGGTFFVFGILTDFLFFYLQIKVADKQKNVFSIYLKDGRVLEWTGLSEDDCKSIESALSETIG